MDRRPEEVARLRLLPQEEDVWQLASEPTPNWLELGDKPMRPWPTFVFSLAHDTDLAEERWCESRPSPEFCWDMLVRAMERPEQPRTGEVRPHRPKELQVRDSGLFEALQGPLKELGVALTLKDTLDPLDGFLLDLGEDMAGPRIPGLLEAPGVTAERVGRLFKAAGAFYGHLHLPKLKVGVAVDTKGLPKNLWNAFVSDEKKPRFILWTEEKPGPTEYLAVGFGDHTDIPVADFEAAQRHGWDVVSPDAYPCFLHKQGHALGRPLPWHLDLVEACLRAVPRLVASSRPYWRGRVAVASGRLSLWMGWQF